jgi:hypothetical protein
MGALADVLAQVSSTDLGAEELAALKVELEKPAYAGKSSPERVALLMAPALIDNSNPQKEIRKPSTVGELRDWLRPIILVAAPGLQQKWVPKSSMMLGLYNAHDVVEYDSSTFQPLRLEALADKLVTQAQMDTMFPMVPDPAYQAKIWVTPCEAVLGDLSVVTLGDVQKAEV